MSAYYSRLEKQSAAFANQNKKMWSNVPVREYTDQIGKTNDGLKKMAAHYKIVEKTQKSAEDLSSKKDLYKNRMTTFFNENTKAAKKYSGEIATVGKAFDNANDAGSMKTAVNGWTKLESKIKAAGDTGRTSIGELMNNVQKFASWFLIGGVISSLTQGVQQMFQNVKDIDAAMTDLRKVTDETSSTYDQFLNNAASKAKEIGVTIKDIISSTADFARLGYSLQEASSLSANANIFANVGDIGIADATQDMISTSKAFNVEAGKSITIVDKLNEVGNNFSTSSSGIGEALKRSAAALSSANNDLDESIALIIAGNAVTQDAEQTGTALKTVSLRIRGTSTDLEAMGEDTEGACGTVSKLREELMALTNQKVDIQLDEDTYKSTYQIMQELSKVWDSMTDKSQAAALEMLFGKRQANIGASLLENFADAEGALESSINSVGKQNCQYVQKCA